MRVQGQHKCRPWDGIGQGGRHWALGRCSGWNSRKVVLQSTPQIMSENGCFHRSTGGGWFASSELYQQVSPWVQNSSCCKPDAIEWIIREIGLKAALPPRLHVGRMGNQVSCMKEPTYRIVPGFETIPNFFARAQIYHIFDVHLVYHRPQSIISSLLFPIREQDRKVPLKSHHLVTSRIFLYCTTFE